MRLHKVRWGWLLAIAGLAMIVAVFGKTAVIRAAFLIQRVTIGRKTVEQRVAQFGEGVDARLTPAFQRAGIEYPPSQLTFVGLKNERVLLVYAAGADGVFKFIKSYRVLAASGTLGPKLQRGDGQVPEGIYAIESLNPNSLYHLSLRVSYPNAFDRQQARRQGRIDLGGDIMIHGSAASIGCLAMGDEAAEDLFVLAARTGLNNITVLLCPVDFRERDLPKQLPQPAWILELYRNLRAALQRLPPPD